MTAGVVVVGGGQAAFSVVSTLRSAGYDGPVTVLAGERHLPYQRPPLSKKFLTDPGSAALELVPESFYVDRDISLLLGHEVTTVDTRAVTTDRGSRISYDHLVLAAGARNRRLAVPGAELAGVHSLRSVDDAKRIGAALPAEAVRT